MKTIDSNKYENFLKRLNKAQETETIIYYKITSPIFNDSGSMVIDEIDDKNVFNKLELKDILSNNSISIDIENTEFNSEEDNVGITACFLDNSNNITLVIEFSF